MLRRGSPTRLYYKKIGALLISEGNVATLSKFRFDDFHLEEGTFSEQCSRASAFNAAFARSHRGHQIVVPRLSDPYQGSALGPPRACPHDLFAAGQGFHYEAPIKSTAMLWGFGAGSNRND